MTFGLGGLSEKRDKQISSPASEQIDCFEEVHEDHRLFTNYFPLGKCAAELNIIHFHIFRILYYEFGIITHNCEIVHVH